MSLKRKGIRNYRHRLQNGGLGVEAPAFNLRSLGWSAIIDGTMPRVYKRGRHFWIDYFVEGTRYRHSIRSLIDELALREIKRTRHELTTDRLYKTRRAIEKIFERFLGKRLHEHTKNLERKETQVLHS